MLDNTEEVARAELAAGSADLDASQPEIQLYERYYAGHHNLKFATEKFREAFGGMFKEFSDNWCEVVIDATVERLEIQGFRFGALDDPPPAVQKPAASVAGSATSASPAQDDASTTEDPQAGDLDAWRIWQANALDCGSEIAHTQAMVAGRCYLLVGPRPGGGLPLVTVEHPSQVTVRCSPDDGTRLSGVKRWYDERTQFAYATVYLPGGIWRFQSDKQMKDTDDLSKVKWIERADALYMAVNTLNAVPVVPLINKESLLGNGDSDLSQVVSMQDLLNKFMTDMTVASEFQAFRQRVLMGVEVLKDDNGRPVPQQELVAAASRLWAFEDPNVKVQELDASDLKNYVEAITLVRNHIAARTRTPPHYLLGEIVNASGDALKAAEAGLVSKARRRMRFFGETWEEVMRLAFLVAGDERRGTDFGAETIWRNPETITESQLMDALGKLGALGVPREILWERAGFTPTEITRMKTLLAAAAPGADDVPAAADAALIRAAAVEGL